jgi:glucose-1-phosphate thymidylyltransferase
MWGIIPAAGKGSRIQPLAFSKELLPVGSRFDGDAERPLAVSEYLVERMIEGGANKICFVVSPGKTDILEYYGSKVYSADVCYTVQTQAAGLCDAIFRALPFIAAEDQEYFGTLVNAWLEAGGKALGVHAGERYVDVGTVHGYREAIRLLGTAYEHV